jgi:predicted nucleic acid-binding protein
MMIVLDTNVLSEPLRISPSPAAATWARSVASERVCTTAVTVGELRYGVARLPHGERKERLRAGVDTALAALGEDGVLPYDRAAADVLGLIIVERERQGRPIQRADAQIAAICRSQGAVLATRNTLDFEGLGLALVNPWDSSAATTPPTDPNQIGKT